MRKLGLLTIVVSTTLSAPFADAQTCQVVFGAKPSVSVDSAARSGTQPSQPLRPDGRTVLEEITQLKLAIEQAQADGKHELKTLLTYELRRLMAETKALKAAVESMNERLATEREARQIEKAAEDERLSRIIEAEKNKLALFKPHHEIFMVNEAQTLRNLGNGERILVVSSGAELRIYDTESGDRLALISGGRHEKPEPAVSADGEQILFKTDNGLPGIWSVQSKQVIQELGSRNVGAVRGAFSPDGSQVATISGNHALIWTTQTGRRVHTLGKPSLSSRIVQGARTIFNKGTGKHTPPELRHRGEITSIVFSPDGRYILTGSVDRSVILWDAVTGEALRQMRSSHLERIVRADFSPDGNRMFVETIHESSWPTHRFTLVWDPGTGALLHVLEGAFIPSGFSRDGRTALVLDDAAGVVKVVNLVTGKVEIQRPATKAALSPDEQMIVTTTTTDGERLQIWNRSMSDQLWTLATGDETIQDVMFSPDSQRLYTLTTTKDKRDSHLKVWSKRRAVPGE